MTRFRSAVRSAAKTARSWLLPSGGGSSGTGTFFNGAANSRLTDWIFAPLASANQELKGDFRALRASARDLARNDPYANRYIQLVAENVIGPDGIQLQAQVRRADGTFDTAINSKIEAAWKDWSLPEHASVDGKLSWVDVQALFIQQVCADGEGLLRMVPAFQNPYGLSLQVLDPDQLDPDHNRARGEGQNEIRMSVEIDGWGRPVAYWILREHPSEYNARDRVRERIPASQIVHLFDTHRPGQTRGRTRFASVLVGTHTLHGYEEAALVSARAGASQMGFLKPSAEDGGGDPNAEGANDDFTMDAEPGTIGTLPPGWDFEKWDPAYPHTGFAEFVKAVLRRIATGLRVSYNLLASDLEGVNYSSLRGGLLSERDSWKRDQSWLAVHLHRRVYLEWMKWAITTNGLELPTRNVSRWSDHRWLPRGWAWVDPLKDIQASKEAIANGLDSRSRILGERGLDFEQVLEDLKHEQELAAEFGITLGDPAGGTNLTEFDDEDEDAPRKPASAPKDGGDRAGRSSRRGYASSGRRR